MKFAYSMLLDFVESSLNAEEAGDLLTMAGFELEGIEEHEGEAVLDVKVMSNRGDGLSMLGLTREILAKEPDARPTGLYVKAAERFREVNVGSEKNPATVTIETPDCTRYACWHFSYPGDKPSPEWIQKRLVAAGQRSISLLVDLTNYVMLELGQPLHAFDYDKLAGGRIVVRSAREGESLKTLDGNLHTLRAGQMMICDEERPVGAAGIMGGEETEVTTSTTRVLLESAHFGARSVRKTRKQLGLNTEASYRFERSVDPDGVVAAINRFAELLGETGSAIVDEYPDAKQRRPISIRVDRARKLLGMQIQDVQAQRYLERLGMEVAGHGDPFVVLPPSWRPDIQAEEDLIEELGRVHGYDQIPELLPAGATTMGGTKGALQEVDRVREAALECGFTQIISHSLQGQSVLDAPGLMVEPRNPASPDMARLRNSVLPGLAAAAHRNGGRDLHLFELGKVFDVDSGGDFRERLALGFLSTGQLVPSETKGELVPQADFFSLKGSIEAILGSVGRSPELERGIADSRLHATRQAGLAAGLGYLGQLHPDLSDELRLPKQTVVAELFLDAILETEAKPIHLKTIARNPAVRRDIALLIDRSVPYTQIESVIHASAGENLERQWLFDIFTGQGIPDGKHSLGIALQLRKPGENFTDEEANQVREQVVQALAALGGATR